MNNVNPLVDDDGPAADVEGGPRRPERTKVPMEYLSVMIPVQMRERIETEAADRGVARAEVVREWLEAGRKALRR